MDRYKRPATNDGTGRGAGINTPSWTTNKNSQYQRTGDNFKKGYTITVCNMGIHTLSPIPIPSKNELPHCTFPFGISEHDMTICCL